MKDSAKSKKSMGKWYFLIIVVLAYLSIYFFLPDKMMPILCFYVKLILQILPIFLLVYVIMVLINYFVNNKVLQKYMGEEAGIKGWVISIIIGILSSGPIYMWYPLMKDLQNKGIKNRFLVAFLYNRGIKLQWLPLLIQFFGWTFSLTLLIVMAIFSVPQGIITEKLIGAKGKIENDTRT